LWRGYNPSQIQRRCPKWYIEVTFHRDPASLACSTRIRCSENYTSPWSSMWARPGPMARSHIAREPCGSRIDKSPSISWLNSKTSLFLWLCLMNQVYSGFFRCEALKWSYFEEVFWVTCAFSFEEKVHSLSVAPRASCYLEQKVGGSWILIKKLKNSSNDMYPAVPEHLFEFFSLVKNLDRGSFIVFLGSRLYV
jgi:hypothetical protein